MGDMGDEIAISLLKGCLKIIVIVAVVFAIAYYFIFY